MTKTTESPIEGAHLIKEVMRLELKPGDLLVFRSEVPIAPNYRVYLEKQLRREFPNNSVVVLGGEFELMAMGEADDPE